MKSSKNEKPAPIARPLLVGAGAVALIALSYFFLDRPVAEGLRPHFSGVPIFVWMTGIVRPLTPAASLLSVVIAIRWAFRRSLTPLDSALLRLALAILVSGVFTYELKEAFGRTWPETWINGNPSYFGNGTFGFFPFHGGDGYKSFPSGHMTAITAFAAALWLLWPAARWFAVLAVLAVAAGLLGADHHWLSDEIAGMLVGGMTGWVAARISSGAHKDGA